MNYPKNMREATKLAHDARSEAFFDLLGMIARGAKFITRKIRAKPVKRPSSPVQACESR